jgi:hypothetical protein
VAEWSKAAVLKTAVGQPTGSSNLSSSARETTLLAGLARRQAALRTFSRTTFGWRAAMRRSASAGPSGVLRSCSQFRRDPERIGELRLTEPDEAPQGSHVASFKLAAHDALALAATKRASEVASGELRGGLHVSFSMYST